MIELESGTTAWKVSEILENRELLEPPEAVVHGLAWRERVTLLAAREKSGKSTLASAAAAAVSADHSFLDHPTMPGQVLWICLEEHIGDFSRRLLTFQGDPDQVVLTSRLHTPLPDIRTLAERIKPALVVVDTLAALVSGFDMEPSSSADWTPIMTFLTNMTRDCETSLLLLHHARKSDGRYRDSSAIGANVDVVIEMMEKPDRARELECKGRWEVGDMRLRLSESGDEYELLQGGDTVEDRVLSFLRFNPGKSKRSVRTSVIGNDHHIDRALDHLVAVGQVDMKRNGSSNAYYLVATL